MSKYYDIQELQRRGSDFFVQDFPVDLGFPGVSNPSGSIGASFRMERDWISDSVVKLSNDIFSGLDFLNIIGKKPPLTQSREHLSNAIANYKNGRFKEALEDIMASLEECKTNYISWFLEGKIYSFGASTSSNVINLDLAIEAFVNAANYIGPDIEKSEEAKLMAAEIYFYLGIALYAKSNDLLRENKKNESLEMLTVARMAFELSYQYSENMLESLFNVARCKAIQGDGDGAIDILETVVLKDSGYYGRVCEDDDFSAIGTQVAELLKKLKHIAFIPAKNDYDCIKILYSTWNGEMWMTTVESLPEKFPPNFTEEHHYVDLLNYGATFKDLISNASFIDLRDNNVYKIVKIGNQVWMAENLRYKVNGGCWCYDDDERHGCNYGRLYTLNAAKRACPPGWHLPTREEWDTLVAYVGGDSVAGKKLKAKSGWEKNSFGNENGTDDYGFSALPDGGRHPSGVFSFDGERYGNWWAATKNENGNAYYRTMNYFDDNVYENDEDVGYGFSVRCVQDARQFDE
jgi:uncharacterized protein (TIGR02145 family)